VPQSLRNRRLSHRHCFFGVRKEQLLERGQKVRRCGHQMCVDGGTFIVVA
jgi:hypothetical protein